LSGSFLESFITSHRVPITYFAKLLLTPPPVAFGTGRRITLSPELGGKRR